MAINIIVEDGSNVAGANSFVTVAEVRLYALERGFTLSTDDDTVAAQLINAKDYLESFAECYKGEMTSDTQPLQWPRWGVCIFGGVEFPSDSIPDRLKWAQCEAVIVQFNGFELMPSYTAQDYVTEETVGPITTKYADPISVGISPSFPKIDYLLSSLKKSNAGSLFTVRV